MPTRKLDEEAGKPLLPPKNKRTQLYWGTNSPGGIACLKATLIIMFLLIFSIIVTASAPSDVFNRLQNVTNVNTRIAPASRGTATGAARWPTSIPTAIAPSNVPGAINIGASPPGSSANNDFMSGGLTADMDTGEVKPNTIIIDPGTGNSDYSGSDPAHGSNDSNDGHRKMRRKRKRRITGFAQ